MKILIRSTSKHTKKTIKRYLKNGPFTDFEYIKNEFVWDHVVNIFMVTVPSNGFPLSKLTDDISELLDNKYVCIAMGNRSEFYITLQYEPEYYDIDPIIRNFFNNDYRFQ